MKLKNKIVAICCLVIVTAIVLTDLLIYNVCADTMLKEALQAAYIESETTFEKIYEYSLSSFQKISKAEVRYLLETQSDDHTVSIKEEEVFFNKTILPAERFTQGKYADYNGLSYKKDYEKGNHIFIFKTAIRGIDFYRIVNITHIYEKLDMLLLAAVIISAVLVTLSVLLLYILIKRTLKPLKMLSESTKRIAEGAYSERITATSKDEIGILASDFNNMANAVEIRTRELEESENRKTLFMANLTHELKTPLTAISGYAQTLRTVLLSEEDKNTALTYIYEESKRLDRLSKKITRLLELDKNDEWVFEPVNISYLFEAAAKSCQVSADSKKVSIEIGYCDGTILGDRDLLCDVLINLTDNAIKASNIGGTVKLYASNNTFTVEDYGCGIPADEIEKITEPFYMIDKSRSRKNGGSGLGLALVKLILNRHGLTMTIESNLEKGTKITVKKM